MTRGPATRTEVAIVDGVLQISFFCGNARSPLSIIDMPETLAEELRKQLVVALLKVPSPSTMTIQPMPYADEARLADRYLCMLEQLVGHVTAAK